jgi:putative tricarboxylic transport membrane protein
MRFSDLTTGLIVMATGVAAAGYARTFPPMPGQDIGPSLFPAIVGVALALVGGALVVSGLRRQGGRWLELDGWARTPRALARVAAVILSSIAYAAVVDLLGFLITGVLLLAVLFAVFGARRTLILPLAIGVTLVIHYSFYTMLGVPLPWGVLEAMAW